jgi:hypothetical protein
VTEPPLPDSEGAGERRSARSEHRAWPIALVIVALVVAAALLTRWVWASPEEGPRFAPRPDALEYAASAQSIAQTGLFFLQIGPDQIRPRYPPGWPMLLAVALKLGVPGDRLWQVAGIFGAALAALLALLAMRMTAALSSYSPPSSPVSVPIAGLLAGGAWALAPLAVAPGQLVMSDEPSALLGVVSIAATAFVVFGMAGTGRRPLLAVLGGLMLGLSASVRPIAAVLLALPLAVLLGTALRRPGSRSVGPVLLPWLFGAAVVPLLTIGLLLHSHLPAFEWSGYTLWVPQHFTSLHDTFQLQYALHGNGEMQQDGSHLWLGARVLAGLPGGPIDQLLGWFWPLVGWLGVFWLARKARRGSATLPVGIALATWTLGHLVVYALYFYPGARFYLAPAAVVVTLFGVTGGLALGASKPVRWVAAVMLAVAAIAIGDAALAFRREPPSPPADSDPSAAVRRWLSESDAERARGTMPFDPLYAQALGLLRPEVVSGIHSWGALPSTPQVRRMRRSGLLSSSLPPP